MVENEISSIDFNLLFSKEEVWTLQKCLNDFGPRLTGSNPHKKYNQFIKAELENYGLEVFEDKYSFNKWEAKRWSLTIENDFGRIEEIPTTFYYPYSGETDKKGVSGELIYCDKGRDFKKARGKIAIVEVCIPSVPSSLLLKKRSSVPKAVKLPNKISNSVVGSVLRGPNLEKAARDGVLGVICIWKNLSFENALNQYLPFTTGYKGCPSLWVDGNTGDKLKELAKKKVKANMILEAVIEKDAKTETIYSVLAGKNLNETIIINTHTDGPNACEENGGIGLLALAKYFSQIPLKQRNRTIIFVFATGHFQLPQFGINNRQATSRWLEEHTELWNGINSNKKAVAALTIEHLGCTEWKDNKKHSEYSQTNSIDIELVYTGNKLMDQIYLKALEGREKIRTITLKPRNNIYFGEGQPLFQVGIPTISLVTAPDYLCKCSKTGEIEKLNIELMYEQITTFLKVILEIDTISATNLGKVEKQSYGIL
ncbi:zinc-binding metallopeptidase family protein [Clostridium saccharoperbutylacetonicum]